MTEMDELAKMFHSEAHERLDELSEALQVQGPGLRSTGLDSARRAAHNLKGAALTVGAQPIAGLCAILENEVKTLAESDAAPSAEQIATCLYIVSEMAGIIDEPSMVRIQLSDWLSPTGTEKIESRLEHTADGAPMRSVDMVAMAATAASINTKPLDIDRLTARVKQVAQIQRQLFECARALQDVHDEAARCEARETGQGGQLVSGLSANLARLRDGVQRLGLVADELAESVE
jgi:HPt (histidine-containing phosphotransfer) domain-containing protein